MLIRNKDENIILNCYNNFSLSCECTTVAELELLSDLSYNCSQITGFDIKNLNNILSPDLPRMRIR